MKVSIREINLVSRPNTLTNLSRKEVCAMCDTSFDLNVSFDLSVHADEVFGESRGGVFAAHTYLDTLVKEGG